MAVSLKSQIAEVERELALRRNVYNRETKPKKIAENELHMAHMRAVLGTLQWLDGLNIAHPLPRPGDLLVALVHIGRLIGPPNTAGDAGKKALLAATDEVRRVVIDVITGTPPDIIRRIRELNEQAQAEAAKQ